MAVEAPRGGLLWRMMVAAPRAARYMDAVLAVVFLGLGYYWNSWVCYASAAFCATTAAVGPLEKLVPFLRRRFVPAAAMNDNAPATRQQRRALDRRAR